MAYLVNFIDDDYRVFAFKSLQLFNEDTWLRINVRALAALDVHRVILATHGNDCGWTFKALTDGLGNRSFTNARWSRQKQDHTLLALNTFVLGNEFKDSLLRFSHTVVRSIKHIATVLHIPEGFDSAIPRQTEHLS